MELRSTKSRIRVVSRLLRYDPQIWVVGWLGAFVVPLLMAVSPAIGNDFRTFDSSQTCRGKYREDLLANVETEVLACLHSQGSRDSTLTEWPVICLGPKSSIWVYLDSSACVRLDSNLTCDGAFIRSPVGSVLDNLCTDQFGNLWVKWQNQNELHVYTSGGELLAKHGLPAALLTSAGWDILAHEESIYLYSWTNEREFAVCMDNDGHLKSTRMGRFSGGGCIDLDPMIWAASGGRFQFGGDSAWCENHIFNIVDSTGQIVLKKDNPETSGADIVGLDTLNNIYIAYSQFVEGDWVTNLVVSYSISSGTHIDIPIRTLPQGFATRCVKIALDGTLFLISNDSPSGAWSLFRYRPL